MLNQTQIMGRIVRTPTLRHVGMSDSPHTAFSIAVERNYRHRDGRNRDVDIIPCSAWNNTAEFITENFKEGDSIIVSGHLQIRNWKSGPEEHSEMELVVDDAYFDPNRTRKDTIETNE